MNGTLEHTLFNPKHKQISVVGSSFQALLVLDLYLILFYLCIFKAILGEKIRRPAILDKDLAEEILSLVEPEDDFQVVLGKTMCTDDFYEGHHFKI